MVFKFFGKKTGSGARASINEEPPKKLHKPVKKINNDNNINNNNNNN